MKKKLKIGIDVDDTIFDTYERFFDYLNGKFKLDKKLEDYNGESNARIFNVEMKDFVEFFWEMEREWDGEMRIEFFDNVKEVLGKLSLDCDIVFVTARNEMVRDITRRKIRQIFDHDDFEVVHIHNKERKRVFEKAEVCEDLGIDVFIDDDFDHLAKCANIGIRCLLFDRKWNKRADEAGNVKRVYNWKEIHDEVVGL